ncbi:bacterial regulatory helix-turn-helix, lysR family protein [Clostridium sporogenes]|uniref:Bacterial regulatory helix-turn-helix, lysR family protein n=1 Tax=Clostridium sporogenes TaxID=1509 RepID=A0A1L3NIL4_CLOSG|nr:LysR family transcriptional regulator [Clostridium sporogenes]APH15901.1 bacterial regulatory helix-turn-helix, lysR family protein [Clostridium sporogenes]
MDIRLLKAFITVATLNNFTQAADQLGYAQSSITSQIQLLEKDLGVHLFERLGKKICLTPEGESFLIYSKQMLFLWEKAKGSIAFSDSPHGTLTIGAEESICAVKLPKLLKEYSQRYPNVEFNIKLGSTDELETLLKENQIDVAILLDQQISVPELKIEMQQQEPLALLVSPDHPLASKKSLYPKDVSDYPLLLVAQGCCYQNLFKKVMNDAHEPFKIMLSAGSIQTLKQFAIFGFGITLLPMYAVNDELKINQLTKLKWAGKSLDLIIQVVRHKDKWISPALKAFLTMCKEEEW